MASPGRSDDHSSTASSRFTFRDAVRSVQAAFGAQSSSASEQQNAYDPFPSQMHIEPIPAGGTSGEDPTSTQRQHFPHLSAAQLEKLFPLPDTPSGSSAKGPSKEEQAALRRRELVRATLAEMELNWKLDPLTLGERSDFNQGCAAIVELLSRVRVKEKDSDPLDYSPMGQQLSEEQKRRQAQQRADSLSSGSQTQKKGNAAFVRHWEPHDVLKAIDRQDHETLLMIRDQAMDLLLDLSTPGSGATSGSSSLRTPLGYSISLGPKWDATSIVICGALSKFVNSLPDDDEHIVASAGQKGESSATAKRRRGHKTQLDPRTMQRLRKLKVNLKLAIDSSIFKDQTNLLASYMQVLIMSEGLGWVADSTESVQRALENHIRGVSSGEGQVSSNPITVANDCVMQFITVNLRSKRDRVSSVNDYVSNAVGDLILAAFWQMVLLRPSEVAPEAKESMSPDLFSPIPGYIFARDDRVATQYRERIRELRRVLDEAKLRADEEEGRRQSRARTLSTTSRKSVAPSELDNESRPRSGSTSQQPTVQLSRNRNKRFLTQAEQLADELGTAFRTSSEQRLELIQRFLKL
ncbi:hypothetical protein OC845_003767 [Tilletia horrida]|nr:hypothetical protein OC845_003767 [Tilletia horrida]